MPFLLQVNLVAKIHLQVLAELVRRILNLHVLAYKQIVSSKGQSTLHNFCCLQSAYNMNSTLYIKLLKLAIYGEVMYVTVTSKSVHSVNQRLRIVLLWSSKEIVPHKPWLNEDTMLQNQSSEECVAVILSCLATYETLWQTH